MKSFTAKFLILLSILCCQLITVKGAIGIDSLDKALSKIKNPDKKVDLILAFLDKPENQYLENTDTYANRAFTIAQQTNYALGKIRAVIKLGYHYFRISDYKKAMEYAQKSKEISEDLGFDKELANSLSLIGTIYNELGDYDKSSEYFFKSLKLFEHINDKEGISQSLGNIGMDFYNQQDYKKALQYFNNALTIANQINSLSAIKRQYNNIAVIYGAIQKYDTAILFLRKALEINKKLGDKLGQGTNIMNIGYDQMNAGKFDDALVSFQQSLDLFISLDNQLHIAEVYLNFGFCHYTTGRTEESIYYFKKALQVGQKQEYYRIISAAAEILNKIYTDRKDIINAYKYVMLEKSAGDSLYIYQKKKLLSKLELQYTYEKKEFQRQLAQQSRNNWIMILIFSLISCMIILFLFLSKYRLKSKFAILEKEKVESELDIKNRELTVNLISLIKKNEMLSGISEKLVQFERNAKGIEAKEIITLISNEMRNSTNDKMLNEFSTRFQEVHAGFYESLLKSYPDLTPNELKLSAFLRLNMTTKDISELTGQELPAIDKARYRLRKKLGIANSDTNLVSFLSNI